MDRVQEVQERRGPWQCRDDVVMISHDLSCYPIREDILRREYSGAADYLYHFRVLSTDNDLNTSAHWGKLASDILTGKWTRRAQHAL